MLMDRTGPGGYAARLRENTRSGAIRSAWISPCIGLYALYLVVPYRGLSPIQDCISARPVKGAYQTVMHKPITGHTALKRRTKQ
jgi:hypothetical protein